MKLSALAAAAALTVSLTACGGSTDDPMTNAEPSTSSMQDGAMKDGSMSDSRTGEFAGLNGKHVSGTVTISDGKVVLSGFSSDEGPDLHLYLAKGDDEAAVMAGHSLGEVDYDEAAQTFELSGMDVSTYDTVVVHCDKAKAVFGAAELS